MEKHRGPSGHSRPGPLSADETLSLWTEDAPARRALSAFAEEAVKEGGGGYVPLFSFRRGFEQR